MTVFGLSTMFVLLPVGWATCHQRLEFCARATGGVHQQAIIGAVPAPHSVEMLEGPVLGIVWVKQRAIDVCHQDEARRAMLRATLHLSDSVACARAS